MNGLSSVFHVGGLVSGIQTDDVVVKLVDIDSQPIKEAQKRQAEIKSRQSAYTDLNARLLALKVQSDRLSSTSNFSSAVASASDNTAVAVTAGPDAIPGSVDIKIQQLAMSNQIISQGFADNTTTMLGKGTIEIKVGAATFAPISIDETNGTLQGIADAINKAGAGVQANLVNDGSETAPWHLLITSKTSGAANQITFTANLDATTMTFDTTQAAQDAKVVIGGTAGVPLTVTSSTNTIDDAMPGLTLQLLKKSDSVTLTTQADTNAVKSMISNFIASYNDIGSFFSQNTFYDTTTKKAGILQGESSAQRMQDDLVNAVTGNVDTGKIRNLASIGITLNAGGTLKITNPTQLDDALRNHLDDVKKLFTDGDNGLAKKISKYVDNVQKPETGVLGIELAYLTTANKALDDLITEKQAAIDNQTRIYRQQFMDMETALSSLQSQSSAVMALLSSGATTSSGLGAGASASGSQASASTS